MEGTQEPLPTPNKLVSITAYAKQYNLNRHTVYRLIRAGILKTYYCRHNDKEPQLDPTIPPQEVRKFGDREGFDKAE